MQANKWDVKYSWDPISQLELIGLSRCNTEVGFDIIWLPFSSTMALLLKMNRVGIDQYWVEAQTMF